MMEVKLVSVDTMCLGMYLFSGYRSSVLSQWSLMSIMWGMLNIFDRMAPAIALFIFGTVERIRFIRCVCMMFMARVR